jgi:aryl-alcohol dehydrogenase-like predicted oxidoreductase
MHAWQFARALGISERHGWTRFVSMQNLVNLLYREEEREMLPLCAAEGIGVIPWLAPVLKQLETEGLPPLGEHVVTGENAREWRINVMRSSAEGRLSMIEALARKPA